MKSILSFWILLILSQTQVVAETEKAWTRKDKITIDNSGVTDLQQRLEALPVRCITCHQDVTPGVFEDWRQSRHASGKVSCLDCHKAEPTDPDAFQCSGIAKEDVFIRIIVSPKVCSKCHEKEAYEFERSDHSESYKSLKAFNIFEGKFIPKRLGETFKTIGCQQCHGSEVKLGPDKKPLAATWPNEGIGRLNPDGSKGSCAACHTRHKFSLAEARRPESCGSCHLGPDHPQLEIYNASKHGIRYLTEGHLWKWESASGTWNARDYTAPTCATCHMSAMGIENSTHDISARLSWELEKPISAKTEQWKSNRNRMKQVCLQCHGPNWIDNFYAQFDSAVELYNKEYSEPAKKILDELYEKGLLTKNDKFDEPFERAYYELWHHEGRRARMGAAMMGQDWAWWEGFYEVAKTFREINQMYEELLSEHNP